VRENGTLAKVLHHETPGHCRPKTGMGIPARTSTATAHDGDEEYEDALAKHLASQQLCRRGVWRFLTSKTTSEI
jgi:hypothetical protein